MKLLIDEMRSRVVAEQLRSRGHDVVAVVERRDLVEKSDEFIFAMAQAEGRAVVTENIPHFRDLATETARRGIFHYGVILTHRGRFPRAGGAGIGRLVTALDALLTSDIDLTNREHWLS